MLRARPSAIVTWHCCGGLVEANEARGATALGTAYATAAQLSHLDEWTAYPITGQLIDAMELQGIAAIDVELRRLDDSRLAAHRAGLEAVMRSIATQPPNEDGVSQ